MSLSGYNVPTRIAPKFGLRVLALFDGSVKMILPAVGKEVKADNSKVMPHCQGPFVQPSALGVFSGGKL